MYNMYVEKRKQMFMIYKTNLQWMSDRILVVDRNEITSLWRNFDEYYHGNISRIVRIVHYVSWLIVVHTVHVWIYLVHVKVEHTFEQFECM